MRVEPIVLTGERVELQPLKVEHLEELFEAAAAPDIWTYMSTSVKSVEDVKQIVETALHNQEAGTDLPFVVFDRETKKIVGSTRFLNISVPNKSLEIGWTWYSPSVWRSRVNTECKYLLLKHSFESLQVNRVQFKTDSRNERSQKAILRLGAIQEGILRKERVMYNGYERDSVVFSILKEEWEDVKNKLEGYLQQK